MSNLPNLPLVHSGDGYILSLSERGQVIYLTEIQRFYDLQNSDPETVPFFSLDEEARHVILQQMQRHYPGRTIRV